ncbi:cupin [Serratia sp. UGAL515B_01]|uniref:cupin n=1 Tax=Serratia sp. UGAL515B_01 TaxID=2986763 RepID=UPI002954AD68|nr:cupin [Serratia sp. UGAL515B_01]WON78752.1 cupin [Serratia sp. UGAL515B_01]
MLVFKAESLFEDLGNGTASRQVRVDDNTCARELTFMAGAFGQLRKLHRPQQVCVISGEFEFTIGNDIHILVAGENRNIPAATLFGCFCLVEGSLLEIPQNA